MKKRLISILLFAMLIASTGRSEEPVSAVINGVSIHRQLDADDFRFVQQDGWNLLYVSGDRGELFVTRWRSSAGCAQDRAATAVPESVAQVHAINRTAETYAHLRCNQERALWIECMIEKLAELGATGIVATSTELSYEYPNWPTGRVKIAIPDDVGPHRLAVDPDAGRDDPSRFIAHFVSLLAAGGVVFYNQTDWGKEYQVVVPSSQPTLVARTQALAQQLADERTLETWTEEGFALAAAGTPYEKLSIVADWRQARAR